MPTLHFLNIKWSLVIKLSNLVRAVIYLLFVMNFINFPNLNHSKSSQQMQCKMPSLLLLQVHVPKKLEDLGSFNLSVVMREGIHYTLLP